MVYGDMPERGDMSCSAYGEARRILYDQEREGARMEALAELQALARSHDDASFAAWEREMHQGGSGIVDYWEGQ